MNVVSETNENVNEELEQEQKEKLFTQTEVNEIVKERLSRERKKMSAQNNDFEELESNLNIRANVLDCREYVMEKGYSKELLDILDTSNAENFKSKADALNELYKKQSAAALYPVLNDGGEPIVPDARQYELEKAFRGNPHSPMKF
ncbi:MAG: hypothetical protein K6A23_13580 [Butyrivibrio sp.]|nr:hypothetical protein [Butyrivibrio sp.]